MNKDFYKGIPGFDQMTDEELVASVKQAVEEFEKVRPIPPELAAWFQQYEEAYLLVGKVAQRLGELISEISLKEICFFGEDILYGSIINDDGSSTTQMIRKPRKIRINRKSG